MDIKKRQFENWNLPVLMAKVAEWIMNNEINVVDLIVDTFDDADNPVCSTVWRIVIRYIED